MLHSDRVHVEAMEAAFSERPSASVLDDGIQRARNARRFVPDAGAKLTELMSIAARSARNPRLASEARRRLAVLGPPRS